MTETRQCPKCDSLSVVLPEDNFCSECGAYLGDPEDLETGNGLCGPMMVIAMAVIFVIGVGIGAGIALFL